MQGAGRPTPPLRRCARKGELMNETLFAKPDVERQERPGGAFVLRSREALRDYERCVGIWLENWARKNPERVFLGERGPDRTWRTVTYAAAHKNARAVGQALLDRGLGPERPLMILSDNGIDHALLMLGAMQVGVDHQDAQAGARE